MDIVSIKIRGKYRNKGSVYQSIQFCSNCKNSQMQHPITGISSIYTTEKGVNIYELVPTDFLRYKTGDFYYANYIIMQQLFAGGSAIDTHEEHKKLMNIFNSSIPAQQKVSDAGTIVYGLLTQHALTFNKNTLLHCCGLFFYTSEDDPRKYTPDNVVKAIVSDPKAYDFFLRRLEPLFARSLSISKKDIQSLVKRNEAAIDLVHKELSTKS